MYPLPHAGTGKGILKHHVRAGIDSPPAGLMRLVLALCLILALAIAADAAFSGRNRPAAADTAYPLKSATSG